MAASIATRRTNSTAAKVSTFSFQDKLPHLPVPTLQETADKYLKTVKPLLLPSQYSATESAVAEFIKSGGIGEKLQERLLDRASKHKNWVYEWWNEAAYMAYRDPVIPYVSYFYSFKDQLEKFPHPAERSAAIITAALEFKTHLEVETLEPEYMRNQPIDMELFKFLFNTCRIPKPNVDATEMYPSKGNEHIIVIRRNRFYKVPYQVNGRQLSTEELELQIREVYGDAELKGTGTNVGILTAENRDRWVSARERLLASSPKNVKSLKVIESSAFVVCLDWASPTEPIERAHQYWHGYGRNRFYDKPVQFIINDNGTAGFMGEHSMMDGTQTLRLNEYVLDGLFNDKVELTSGTEYTTAPVELEFEINDAVATDIAKAEKFFHSEISQHEVAVWSFKKYGKNLIKQFKVSPDAYVQMLLQLAYYRMHGRVRPVYESATTRKFIQGRTETTRSVSSESADLCAKFWNPNVAEDVKIKLFRDAVKSQVAYIADATEGKGVDRHLFGLKRLLKPGEELPSIYKDPAFAYSGSWYISSSQLSSEYFNGYGWSQVIDEGFGMAYMINKNDVSINICSKYQGSHKMKLYLEEAAIKLAKLLSSEVSQSKL